MRKVIAAINMTLDGVCDHTVGIVDEKLHQHYSELINNSGVIFYGRTTYQLMQFWQNLLKNPSGKKSMDDFALAIDRIPKIVYSLTFVGVLHQQLCSIHCQVPLPANSKPAKALKSLVPEPQ